MTYKALIDAFTKIGRVLFGIAMIVFGIQHFIFARFVATLVPAWIPGHLFWAYFTGSALIAAGVSILVQRYARLASVLLGSMLLIFILLIHLPRILHNPGDAAELTNAFKDAAIAGGALILARRFAGIRATGPDRLRDDGRL